MKIKEGFVLRRVLGDVIVVPSGEVSKDFHGMIKLNDSAADIWEWISAGKSEEEISKLLSQKYDISKEKAESDTRAMIEKMLSIGLFEQ